jgi:hypothetical protein
MLELVFYDTYTDLILIHLESDLVISSSFYKTRLKGLQKLEIKAELNVCRDGWHFLGFL